MAIEFKYVVHRRENTVVGDKSLGLNGPHMAWWHCGFKANGLDPSQPLVLMAFRKIEEDGLSKEVIYREISVAALGQVRRGSIWQRDTTASISAPEVHSDGIVLDMWNAMKSLETLGKISSVQWYTDTSDFSSDPVPKLTGLRQFNDSDKISARIKSFPFLDRGRTLFVCAPN